jgi:hypothetical protein
MLTIDHLRLSLPSGFEGRADRIARLVADELATAPMAQSAQIDRLDVPAVEIGAQSSDRQVATAIAARITSSVGGPR